MHNLIADVKLSIELEKKGYDFYSQTAKKTSNPLAVSTLASLAERELVHLEKIKEFYRNLTGEKKLATDWLKDVEVSPTKAELLKTIVEKLRNNLARKFETQEDINAAYLIAEGLEKDSYTLYDKIASESTDQTANIFYAALAREEKEHFAILDETMQYLNDPAEWFKQQERWIVEG
ncbi:MAG: ferritin family protein [Candidatus Margulisiibacteriota bacterium]